MKIFLNEMVFYGYHGVQPEERALGQRFIVNLVIETVEETDRDIHHLQDTVDYTMIYEEVKHTMEKKQFHLLENCANEILDAIISNFDKVIAAEVRIKKPSVPINGSLGSVEIEMQRRR